MTCVVLIASLLATLIPTLAYARILRSFDRYQKTIYRLGMIAFLWGLLPAVLVTMVADLFLSLPFHAFDLSTNALTSAGIVAPLTEEPSKALILFLLFVRLGRAHDDPLVWIIYGGLSGFGFALTENIAYFYDAWTDGGWTLWSGVVFVRALFFGMNHALYTSLTGLGLGLARVQGPFLARVLYASAGLGAAMLFHSLHNVGIVLAKTTPSTFQVSALVDWAGVLGMGILLMLIKREEKNRTLLELREEVEAGLIDADDFALACSFRARLGSRLWGLVNSRARRRVSRLAPLLADLAVVKYLNRDSERNYAREISELRIEIALVRASL